MNPKKDIIFVLILLVLISTISCDRTRNEKGFEYFPDMAHSYAYETYSENPVFKDGKTMQDPPEGSVSRNALFFNYPADIEGRKQAGIEMINPIESNAKALAMGKEHYDIFCINCHGEKGDGKGHLFTSGKYAIQPASLINERMKTAPDGEFFHVITSGYGVMGAHGAQVPVEKRWAINHYVRTVLLENVRMDTIPSLN